LFTWTRPQVAAPQQVIYFTFKMKIGIIGAGHIGSALAGRFTSLGHSVQIANSRGPETLKDVAQKPAPRP
jgi:phosphoglycerate dehydrogenase-like enzyme